MSSSSWAISLDVGVGLGEHGFGVGDALLEGAVLAELFDGGLHVAVLLGDGLDTSSGR